MTTSEEPISDHLRAVFRSDLRDRQLLIKLLQWVEQHGPAAEDWPKEFGGTQERAEWLREGLEREADELREYLDPPQYESIVFSGEEFLPTWGEINAMYGRIAGKPKTKPAPAGNGVTRAYLRHRLKVRVPKYEDPEVLADMLAWLETAPDADLTSDEAQLQGLVHARGRLPEASLPSDVRIPA